MSGITELATLISAMQPTLMANEFVFCTVQGELADYVWLNPLASFSEVGGLTLIVRKTTASDAGLAFSGIFKQITLNVHSSLNAVGLTAAVSGQLAAKGISANVFAAYYHDHIFVAAEHATAALSALTDLSDGV